MNRGGAIAFVVLLSVAVLAPFVGVQAGALSAMDVDDSPLGAAAPTEDSGPTGNDSAVGTGTDGGPSGVAEGGSADAGDDGDESDGGEDAATDGSNGPASDGVSDASTVESDGGASDGGDDASNVSVGARFSGVVEVHNASLAGEIDRRAYAFRYGNATSPGSRAGVVAQEYRHLSVRMESLRDRRERLTTQFDEGKISVSAYHARAMGIYAESRVLQRLANDTSQSASGLPDAALRKHGVGADDLDRLRLDARNLSGPEISSVARTIGGDRSEGPPSHSGGPADGPGGGDATVPEAEESIATAASQIARVRYVSGTEERQGSETLTTGSNVAAANALLSQARSALEVGATGQAVRLANQAHDRVDQISTPAAPVE